MDFLTYDFGYTWPWTYGHLVAVAVFGVMAALAWRLKWSRWIWAPAVALSIWGVVGFAIVQVVLRMNLPLELPTQQFLPEGSGRVLDVGAGSGRSTLMVLLERPRSRVLALDLYDGYFGISDNTPDRLLANAAIAGARDRVETKVGDMRQIPLASGTLDAAVSAYAIDHLDRDGIEHAVAEVERILRPGGQFLLLVINPDRWTRLAYPFLMHHAYWGPQTNHDRWRGFLTGSGFEVVEQGTTGGTLYLLARKQSKG